MLHTFVILAVTEEERETKGSSRFSLQKLFMYFCVYYLSVGSWFARNIFLNLMVCDCLMNEWLENSFKNIVYNYDA